MVKCESSRSVCCGQNLTATAVIAKLAVQVPEGDEVSFPVSHKAC